MPNDDITDNEPLKNVVPIRQGNIVQLNPEPTDVIDVLNEVDSIKGELRSILIIGIDENDKIYINHNEGKASNLAEMFIIFQKYVSELYTFEP